MPETDPPGNENITVKAKFSAKKLNVRFINNGVVVAVKEVTPNGTVNSDGVPAVVTEDGEVFSHWSADPGGDEFNFSTQITEDTNLYLVTKSQYRVIFASNGGSYVEEQHITHGDKVEVPLVPVRQGYIFSHWSKTNNGEAYNFADLVVRDFTLYACLLYTSRCV